MFDELNEIHVSYQIRIHQPILTFFSRDVEDEEAWIWEKEPIISSSNRGKDLIGVQNLIKKHTSMSGEINHHEPKLEQVINVKIICPLYCYNYLSQ